MVLPSYDGEVIRVCTVSWLVAVSINGWGFLQVHFIYLSKGPACLSYVLLIANKLPTLIPVDGPILPVERILVFRLDQYILNSSIPLEMGLGVILPTYLFDTLSWPLCIRYDYMPLILFILGKVPPCSVTAGVITIFFTRFSLGVCHITIFQASIDEFPFYLV